MTREIQIRTTMKYHLRLITMVIIKNSTNNKCWREFGEKGTLLHSLWDCKLIQQLWRTVWRVLGKLGIKLPLLWLFSHCHVWLFVTSWTAACQTSVSITISQSLLKIHVHWVDYAIEPSHPLSSPSPPALNLSQHQSLFQWVSSLHQVAKVLEFQPQHQSFQWTPRTDLL